MQVIYLVIDNYLIIKNLKNIIINTYSSILMKKNIVDNRIDKNSMIKFDNRFILMS